MNRENVIWVVLFVLGGAFLLGRVIVTKNMGSGYLRVTEKRFVDVAPADATEPKWVSYDSPEILESPYAGVAFESIPASDRISWRSVAPALPSDYMKASAADPAQTTYRWSWRQTIGIWIAAFFTLAIFSFLYRDNPFYKIAESVVVGVSAAYWMVVGYWDVLVPNLIGKLWPTVVKAWSLPGLDLESNPPSYWYIVPLLLGVMLLMRLSPKGAWMSRWPLAFIIGTTAGIRLVGFIHADFLSQIRNSIVPLFVIEGGGFDIWETIKNAILVLGVLSCLVYFFFSFEHKGFVGKTARLGIWFLMITFGAAFGYTVMGRIALLAIRLEFLFDDWLWLIDPTGKRLAMLVAMIT